MRVADDEKLMAIESLDVIDDAGDAGSEDDAPESAS